MNQHSIVSIVIVTHFSWPLRFDPDIHSQKLGLNIDS